MISKEKVKKLSNLARIEISEEEAFGMSSEIEEILEYVRQINKADLQEAEERALDKQCNVLREDKAPHKSEIFTDDLIPQALNSEKNWIKVKKILEN